jgi:hypothetical protein
MTGFGARVPFVFVDGKTGVGERVVITPLTRGFENDLFSGRLLRVKLRVLVGVMFLEALLIGAGRLVVVSECLRGTSSSSSGLSFDQETRPFLCWIK